MNDCLSEWDVPVGDIDVAMHSMESFPPNRGRWDQSLQRKYSLLEKSYSPNNELEELCWDNGQLFVLTSSLDNKVHKQRNWPSNASTELPFISNSEWDGAFARLQSLHKAGCADSEWGATLAKLQSLQKAGSLASAVPELGNIAVPSACDGYMQEDEMASWLQYPSDEPLEKYCPELAVDSRNLNKCHARERGQNMKVDSIKAYGYLPRAVTMDRDSVKSLGSLSKSEAASNVCTLKQNAASKQEDGHFATNSANGAVMLHGTNAVNKSGLDSSMAQVLPKATPRLTHSRTSVPTKKAPINFSLFSRPAAAMKARLQTVMAAGPTETERFEQLDRVVAEGCMSKEFPGKPVITELNTQPAKSNGCMLLDSAKGIEKIDETFVQQPVQSISCREDTDSKLQADNITSQSVKHGFSCSNPCATNSVSLGPEKGVEIVEACDPTVTASSGGFGNSALRNEKVSVNLGKRKAQDAVDTECQSKDPKEGQGNEKKSAPSLSTSTKRSRAAEVHNQAERRRRDRINEKLRALQELIPNSNKTDKASLLEEAIEYLKVLQMQLLVMSYQSGMSVSPMLIPPGMQHLQMTQTTALPHMHMGLGMGMGMIDMNAATPSRPLVCLPPFPRFSIPGSIAVPSPAMASLQGHVTATVPSSVVPAASASFCHAAPAVPGSFVFKSPEYALFPTIPKAPIN